MIFTDMALRALHDYRRLLKRYYSVEDRTRLLQQLDLVRPRKMDKDIELWETLNKIYIELENLTQSHPKNYYTYSGIEQYFNFLSGFLQEYNADQRCVYHKAQRASSLLVNIIQIVSLPLVSLTRQIENQLKKTCAEFIVLASDQQRQKAHSILIDKYKESPDFYGNILKYYMQLDHQIAKNNNS